MLLYKIAFLLTFDIMIVSLTGAGLMPSNR